MYTVTYSQRNARLTGLAVRDGLAARAPALRRLPTDSAARLSVQPRERVKLERAGGQEDRDVERALAAPLQVLDDRTDPRRGEQVRVLLEDAEEELLLERGRLDVQERAPDRGRVLVCLVERPLGALGRGGAVEGAVHDDDRGCLLVDLEDVRDLRWAEVR